MNSIVVVTEELAEEHEQALKELDYKVINDEVPSEVDTIIHTLMGLKGRFGMNSYESKILKAWIKSFDCKTILLDVPVITAYVLALAETLIGEGYTIVFPAYVSRCVVTRGMDGFITTYASSQPTKALFNISQIKTDLGNVSDILKEDWIEPEDCNFRMIKKNENEKELD